jgi:tetratricopeptide (TPR) repeat protein
MRRTLALGLLALMAIAGNAFGQAQARITGKVTDAATKAPIENATIHVEALAGKTFKEDFHTKKDGTYAIFLLDGTIKYKFTFSATGYMPYAEDMKLQIAGAPNTKDVQLQNGTPAPAAQPQEVKGDPATEAFNEGAKLANAGDTAGAIKKITEAVTLKPDLIAGWEALANLEERGKNWKGVIDDAKEALALADDETEMWQLLYEAYSATGDKAAAAEAKKKLPTSAAGLFNDAVPLLNAGKYAEAEPILLKVIAIDPNFADAYYHLGIASMSGGDMAKAKTYFKKYLELAPNGQYADVAKEGSK